MPDYIRRVRIDTEGPGFIYLQIASELREAIKRGDLLPGRPVPSIEQIRREHGFAVMTIRKAIKILADEGWVQIVPSKGTFVAPREEWPQG